MGTRLIALGAIVMAVAGCNALAGIEPGVLAQEDASADGASDAAHPDGTAGEAGGTPDATSDGGGGQETGPTSEGGPSNDASTDAPGSDGPSGNEGGSADGGCPGTTTCNDGCLGDVHNCGSCGTDCTALPHVSGSVTCNGGTCNVPTSSCAAGWTYCTGNGSTGCTTSLASTSNCGSCGNVCSAADPDCAASGSTFTCVSGCSGGQTLCSGSCVDSQTDPLGCGASCTVCPTPGNGNATCTNGSCGITCDSGYNDCGGTCAANSPAACGASCTVCPVPGNGSATCPSGTCGISCNSGYNDCGGSCVANGPSSCGPSCTACPTIANGTPTCSGSTCGTSCNGGYNLCSGSCVANGPSSCGPSCTVCPSIANGTPTCSGATCGFTCNANYTTCNGGCADYQTDAANCGSCGHSCGGGTCSNGVCQAWVVTTAVTTPQDLASDGTNVVWTDNGTGEVEQVAAVGAGTPIVIASGYGKTLSGLSLVSGKIAYTSGTHVYVGTEGSANSGTLLATATYPIFGAVLNPSATTVYVTEAATSTSGYDGAILQCSLSGSSCSSLITLSNAFVYGLLVDASYLFWADNNNQLIGRYVFSSGTQSNVLTGLDVNLVANNGTTLYWALDTFGGTIYSTPEANPGTQSTVCTVPVPTSDGLVYSIAADASYFYAGTNGSSTQPASLVACPAGGGSPTTLYSTAADNGSVAPVVAAGGYVFWIDEQATYSIKAIRAP